MNYFDYLPEKKGRGFCGALLFALSGGIVWYLLRLVGFVPALGGAVGVIMAMWGYSLFGGRRSRFGMIASVISSLLVCLAAWYLCLTGDVFAAYKSWFAAGEVDFMPTFGQCFKGAHLFLREIKIAVSSFRELGFGLIFTVLGALVNSRALNADRKNYNTERDQSR